ncbi:MAG TPA: branched-chain amino acid ABC transporter substrate-binding protein [Dissulfurispiraceae bacterium]|nr:branched-chain amino acid ABC transporter substrate-binding protein [Dissulfurispiraceae bacterium]
MSVSLAARVLVMTVILLVATAAGCQKSEQAIRIGIAGPMTGPDAKMGTDFKNGASIAIEEWNSAGGVLGKKIETDIEDDQSDPKQAVAIANKLVNEGVIGIIGHFNSSCSIPASDVYERAGKPMITPASTNPQLTGRGYKGVFRVCGTDDQQGRVAAGFVRDRLGLKKIAVIHDKTTYGQGLADIFKDALGKGIEVTYYGGITKGDKDFKTVLTSVKQKNPELIFFGGTYADAGLLVKQAREIGISVPFMSGDGTIDQKFIEIAGDKAAEGTYLTFSPDPAHISSANGFIEKYKKKYGELGPYSIYSYVAMNILLDAAKSAGTADGKAIINKLRTTDFSTALGRIKFDEKGDVSVAPYIVWITRNGKFEEFFK